MEETKAQFNIELRNIFAGLDNIFEDPEEAWEHIKTIYNTVSVDVLGYSHKPTEEWIAEDTWNEIKQRKECKKKLVQENNVNKKQKLEDEYRERDKNVKRKARRDKRSFVDKLAISAEGASQMGDMRTLYNITKKLAGD